MAHSLVLPNRNDLHVLRKVWHISTGCLGLYFYYNLNKPQQFWAWFYMAFAIAGFSLDFFRLKNEKFNTIFMNNRFISLILRNSEQDGFSGLPFYALGVSLSFFFYEPNIALLSIMFLIFGDPASSFLGVLFGKDKILPNKSLQGSIAGFFTCYLVTLFYVMEYNVPSYNLLIFSIMGGVIGCLAELFSAFNIDDNLTIPVVSGLALTILNYVIPVFY